MPGITLYAHDGPGPNPPKVAILLEELKIDYTVKKIPFGPEGVKGPEFTKLNPNGRVPAIVDHDNNDFVVWESGACLTYLAEKYGPQYIGKTPEERAEVMQWLCFQLSGVGPAQGQANWFIHYWKKAEGAGKDADPAVIKRYQNESKRCYSVLEEGLKRQKAKGSEFIALDRLTIADIALIPWIRPFMAGMAQVKDSHADYPLLEAYIHKLDNMPTVKAAFEKC